MIPVPDKLKDDLKKKYSISNNLPKNIVKKPVLSDCYSCERYERGEKVGMVEPIDWCISKEFDKIKKRPVTHYANIELLRCCPKMVKR